MNAHWINHFSYSAWRIADLHKEVAQVGNGRLAALEPEPRLAEQRRTLGFGRRLLSVRHRRQEGRLATAPQSGH
jgi:hypothetical protein